MIALFAIIKPIWGWLLSIARTIPWWAWLVAGLLLAAWVYGERKEAAGRADGMAEVQGEWDKANAIQAERMRELEAKSNQVTDRVVTKAVEVVKTVKVKGDTIVQQVPVYVPSESYLLPGGFRLLHDAAASGVPLPETPGGVQAEPVHPQAVAATVAGNYRDCRAELAKFSGLWEWSEQQSEVTTQ